MNRGVRALDRFAVLLTGLVLVALGLGLLEWRYQWLGTHTRTLDTSGASTLVASSWWPWAFAAATVLLGLLAVWWLLAHLRRPGPSTLRLGDSGPRGTVEVDLHSLASAAATRLEERAPLAHVSGTTRRTGRHTVVQLRGNLREGAGAAALTEAVRCADGELRVAMSDDVSLRVLVDAPRRRRLGPGRGDRVRIR